MQVITHTHQLINNLYPLKLSAKVAHSYHGLKPRLIATITELISKVWIIAIYTQEFELAIDRCAAISPLQ